VIDLEGLLGAVAVGRPGWETAPLVLFSDEWRSLAHDVGHANFEPWQRIEDTCGLRRGPAGSMEVCKPMQCWLFLLDRPRDLFVTVPRHWLEPQPTKLANGITWPGGMPRNLWVGTTLRAGFESEVEALLEMRVVARFLVRRKGVDLGTFDPAVFQAWRCRICGERGRAPRPDRCRRWKRLCSEGTLEPLVHRLYDEVGDLVTAARAQGVSTITWFK
jgi:hypothetical protein